MVEIEAMGGACPPLLAQVGGVGRRCLVAERGIRHSSVTTAPASASFRIPMICFCIRYPPVKARRSMQVLCFCSRSAHSRRHDGVRGSVRFKALRRARGPATTDHANSLGPRPASSAQSSVGGYNYAAAQRKSCSSIHMR